MDYIMDSGTTMLFHAVLLMLLSYVLMRYVLGQSSSVAENRSVLLGGLALVYMVLFGHGLPGRINPRIM
jgi:TRAP-type C4-dicarboxylate transport system permease small subunit